jgi:competence protein ComEA
MSKQLISTYFNFTKKERNGTIVLLVLIFLFTLAPLLYPIFVKTKKQSDAAFINEMNTLTIKERHEAVQSGATNKYDDNTTGYYSSVTVNNVDKPVRGTLFYFDPNTATTSDWQRLGVKDKTITTIQNYILKGGHFYKPQDISKIWGLHLDEVQRLLPYVKIAANETNHPQLKYEPKKFDKPSYTSAVIDINIADTTVLIALPGIGSKLAQRIINFRDKLGGFYKTAQIGETFGLPDSTFQKLKARFTINSLSIKQFNINTATVEEMKTHPYIRYVLANAIVQYRTQHGNFTAVTDIKNIMTVTEQQYDKAAPYLTIQ